jgi:hypothetical protein
LGREKRRVPVGQNGWGTFCGTAKPLGALFIVDRRPAASEDDRIDITRLSQQRALMALISHSFGARLADALGRTPQRLDLLAQLVKNVPVCRLSYPSGFEKLARVRNAVEAYVAGL